MSSLVDVEKRYLEKILGMQSGWVLDYSDATFGGLFSRHKVDIHNAKYQTYGTSKAKKLRAFWEVEPDDLVGKVLSEMLDSYEAGCHINGTQVDVAILEKARQIVSRLTGKVAKEKANQLLMIFCIMNLAFQVCRNCQLNHRFYQLLRSDLLKQKLP